MNNNNNVDAVMYANDRSLVIHNDPAVIGENVIVRFLDGTERRGIITGVKCIGGWTNWDGKTQSSMVGDMSTDPVYWFDLGQGSKNTQMHIAVKLDRKQ